MNWKERNKLAVQLAFDCDYDGRDIAKIFCQALSEANFHEERKKLVPKINKLFNTRISREG